MTRKITLGLLWLGFIAYAFFLAPPDRPETLDLIKNLSTGQITGINPLLVSLFNLMGIFPIIYSCVILVDGRGQKLLAWPFALASFALGAFALLPYLALRDPNPSFTGPKTWGIKLLESKALGLLIVLGVALILRPGLYQGDWSDFVQQWHASRFIHVMSLDFCLLSALFPLLLDDDMARRGLSDRRLFWAVALVPLLGPAVYLALRPDLPDSPAAGAKTDATDKNSQDMATPPIA